MSAQDQRTLRKAFLLSPLISFKSLDRWQDPEIARRAAVEVYDVGRFQIRPDSDDLWHVSPSREAAVMSKIRTLLKAGDTFVDAGANIGFYTVLASKLVGPNGRVIAIEMMPDTAEILRNHIMINGLTNIEVVELALSDKAGERVQAYVDDGKFGQASIADTRGGRAVEVTTTTLDDLLRDVPSVALMKMDLEGAEPKALRGAGQRLEAIRAIISEVLPEHESAQDVLAEFGFAVTWLDGRNWIAMRE